MSDFHLVMEEIFQHYQLPHRALKFVAGVDTLTPTLAASPQPELDKAVQQLVADHPNLPGVLYNFLAMHFMGSRFEDLFRKYEEDIIQVTHERRANLMQFAVFLIRLERFMLDKAGIPRESIMQCPLPLVNFVYLVQYFAIDQFDANRARLEAQLKRRQLAAIGDVLEVQYMTPVAILETNPVEAAYTEAAKEKEPVL